MKGNIFSTYLYPGEQRIMASISQALFPELPANRTRSRIIGEALRTLCKALTRKHPSLSTVLAEANVPDRGKLGKYSKFATKKRKIRTKSSTTEG